MSLVESRYLVNKFVKRPRSTPGLTHECGFDKVGLVEAEPDDGNRSAWVLRERMP